MRRTSWLIVVLFLLPASAFAQGWNDYDLDLGNGYTLFRANSMDIGIRRSQGDVVVFGTAWNGAGPIVEYAVTPTHIFTRHAGRKLRNKFKGDTFEDVDFTQEMYFIVDVANQQTFGPLTPMSFEYASVVQRASPIKWVAPTHPEPGVAIAGSLWFLAVTVAIFGGGILAVMGVIAFVVIAGVLIWRRVRAVSLATRPAKD